MLKLILGTNGVLLRNIVAKFAMTMLRKYGLNAKIKCGDFAVYREGDKLTIHLNGDMTVTEKELMEFLDNRIDG